MEQLSPIFTYIVTVSKNEIAADPGRLTIEAYDRAVEVVAECVHRAGYLIERTESIEEFTAGDPLALRVTVRAFSPTETERAMYEDTK